jgi:nitrate reductase gamma subunit
MLVLSGLDSINDDVLVCAAGILTMIIVRTLRRDIARYNKVEDEVRNEILYVIVAVGVNLLYYCQNK